MLFISDAMAQDVGVAAQPGIFENIIPLVVIFGIFYFLLIRPQQKKLRAHNQLVSSVKRNDEVVISGGIIGKIAKVEENILQLEIAKDVIIRVNRSSVTDVVDKKAEKTEKIDKEEKPKKEPRKKTASNKK